MARKALVALVVCLGVAAPGYSQEIASRQVYSVLPVEGGIKLEIGGTAYGPFASIEGTPWFTRDSASWGMAVRKPDGALAVLVDGQEKAAYPKDYNRLSDLSVSPDGTVWSVGAALATDKQPRDVRIVDGKAYGPYDRVGEVTWSPAGKGWYFRAESGGSVFIVHEGKKFGPFQRLSDAAFDAAGKQLVLVVSKADGWARVVVNGTESGPYSEAEIVRTGAGAYLGYMGTLKNGSRELMIAEKKYGPYSYVDWGRQYVSADGKDWLVMVFRGAKRILLQNGKEAELGRLSVYKLAQGWMYTWEKGSQEFVVFGGKQFGPYETGRNLTVSRDGSSWAITHKRTLNNVESSFVSVSGKEYSGTGFAHVTAGAEEYFSWISGGVGSDAVYNRFGKELVTTKLYALGKSAQGVSVTAGGTTWGPYKEIAASPWASPDGSHWGVLVRVEGDRFVVLAGGAESQRYGPYARCSDFSMNAAGTGWCFTAVPDAKAPGTMVRVANGTAFGPFTWVDLALFSRDGTGFSFWGQVPGKNAGAQLVFNGKSYGPWASGQDRMVADPDAGVFAMLVRGKDDVSVRVNDALSGPYRDVELLRAGTLAGGGGGGNEPAADNAGGYFGFVAILKDGTREIHVQGDKTYGPYTEIRRGWIAADGRDWRFIVHQDGNPNDILLENGVERQTMGAEIMGWADGYLVFSRSDGMAGLSWKGGSAGPYSTVQQIRFTADGRTWAADAVKGDGPGATPVVVLNGTEHPGEGLRYVSTESAEYFTWLSHDSNGSGILNVLATR